MDGAAPCSYHKGYRHTRAECNVALGLRYICKVDQSRHNSAPAPPPTPVRNDSGVRESASGGPQSEAHLSPRVEDEKSISARLIDAALEAFPNIPPLPRNL
ncbi:hypothetical protein CBL_05858 [Carabus blaptoides fortunei]